MTRRESKVSTELRFDGKVALVTGGGAGIGRAYCRLLAERGAKVVVNGNVRESGAGPEAEVVAEIRAAGGEAIGVNGSISDDGAARRMIEEAVDTFGRLDILINNAGAGGKSPLIYEAPNADTERLIENHLYGPLRMSRAAFPHLAKSGAGRIINTGSSSALGWESPSGWRTCYIAAKSALFGITRQMAGAGAEHGIKVNMIMPWAFSSMVDRTIGNLPFGKWMREKLPPERVSPVVAFLAHESCPVTGQFISAAGGRVTRIVYASSHGYFNPDLTVEDVRDNWATITGEADDAGGLAGYFELEGQSSEFKEILKLVGK
jgi:NAD(P)-dependent dehydrogenase (short-subunit alcohol dehydrogenase family)